MKDQQRAVSRLGVKAIVGSDANEQQMEDIKRGFYELVFVSPEHLLTHTEWRDMIQSSVFQVQLDGIIIDEAHCIKTW